MAATCVEINASNPTVTIGVTCFNARDTIERALQSVLGQDWPSLDVIIIDDCSSDGSWEIVEAWTVQHPYVRAFRNPVNQGAATSRNTILHHAVGEFIAFFDDDDESSPGRISGQLRTLLACEARNGPADVACFASAARRYPNGYELNMPAIGSSEIVPYGEGVADYLLYNSRKAEWFYGAGTPTCALMARVSTLKAVGGFDASLRRVEDVDLAVRLALRGCYFVGTPQQLVLQHATVSPDKNALANFQSETMLIEKHAAYLHRRRSYDYAKRWFYIRYLHFDQRRLPFMIHIVLFLLRYPVRSFKHMLNSLPKRWLHERKMRSIGNYNQ